MSTPLRLALTLTALTSGCYSIASVERDSPARAGGTERLPGLPYFLRHAVHRQVEEYWVTWKEVRLDIGLYVKRSDSGGSKLERLASSSMTAIVDRSEKRRIAYGEVLGALQAKDWSAEALVDKFRSLAMINDPVTGPGEQPDRFYAETTSELDYSEKYYVDVRAPWAGSAKFEPAFTPDGALASAKFEAESRVDELVPALLPVQSIWGKLLKLPDDGGAPERTSASLLEVFGAQSAVRSLDLGARQELVLIPSLTETTVGYRDVYSKRLSSPEAADFGVRLRGNKDSKFIEFRRLPLDGASKPVASKDSSAADKPGDKVEFSGAVILPKN